MRLQRPRLVRVKGAEGLAATPILGALRRRFSETIGPRECLYGVDAKPLSQDRVSDLQAAVTFLRMCNARQYKLLRCLEHALELGREAVESHDQAAASAFLETIRQLPVPLAALRLPSGQVEADIPCRDVESIRTRHAGDSAG